MKFLHLSDLHLGKRLNAFSLLEDQQYMLSQLCDIVEREQTDAVILAGDIYDKAVPSAEAVQLFDHFLSRLVQLHQTVLLISGNHDSPERIAFGASLMESSHVHIAPVFSGTIAPVVLHDAYGEIFYWLLPFVRPAQVRPFFPDAVIGGFQDAVQTILESLPLDPAARNLMVTHQFVAGASLYDSGEQIIGGTDQICADLFAPFDYTALGHIHRPQQVTRENIRYSGSPLKYSLSEAPFAKTVPLVELREKGSLTVTELPLHPLRDLRRIRGTYLELTARSYYAGTAVEDYIAVTLTDENDIPDAVGKLRTIYPNLLEIGYDNQRTRDTGKITGMEEAAAQDPFTLFAALYAQQNHQPMLPEQEAFLRQMIQEVWEEDDA